MTPKDYALVKDFESEQPAKCPHCGHNVASPFKPQRIVHDIAACAKNVKAPAPKPRFEGE
jgi:hypothetical protein